MSKHYLTGTDIAELIILQLETRLASVIRVRDLIEEQGSADHNMVVSAQMSLLEESISDAKTLLELVKDDGDETE